MIGYNSIRTCVNAVYEEEPGNQEAPEREVEDTEDHVVVLAKSMMLERGES